MLPASSQAPPLAAAGAASVGCLKHAALVASIAVYEYKISNAGAEKELKAMQTAPESQGSQTNPKWRDPQSLLSCK